MRHLDPPVDYELWDRENERREASSVKELKVRDFDQFLFKTSVERLERAVFAVQAEVTIRQYPGSDVEVWDSIIKKLYVSHDGDNFLELEKNAFEKSHPLAWQQLYEKVEKHAISVAGEDPEWEYERIEYDRVGY